MTDFSFRRLQPAPQPREVAEVVNGLLDGRSNNRGTVTLWDGGSGNTPAYILMHSRNGTANYLFFEDDGTLKRHTSVPAANADGDEIGGQT